MALKVDIEKREEGIYAIKLDGRLDADTCDYFEEKIKPLLMSSQKVIILDLLKLTHISSTGLGVIFKMKEKIKANKGSLIMTNIQPQVKKVFEIVKALPKESIFKDMAEVDRYLNAIQQKEAEKHPPTE